MTSYLCIIHAKQAVHQLRLAQACAVTATSGRAPAGDLGILNDQAAATDALEYGDLIKRPHRVAMSLSAVYRTQISAVLVTALQVLTSRLVTHEACLAHCTQFPLCCRVFEDAGFTGKLRAVLETQNRIDLAYVELALLQLELEVTHKHEKGGDNNESAPQPTAKPVNAAHETSTHLIYLLPTFSKPSGRTVPLSHRRDLIALARGPSTWKV